MKENNEVVQGDDFQEKPPCLPHRDKRSKESF